jgi:hypothetical protein
MTRFRAEIAALDEHWQGGTIAVMLRHAKAGDIGASRAGNADFGVIKTHLSQGIGTDGN